MSDWLDTLAKQGRCCSGRPCACGVAKKAKRGGMRKSTRRELRKLRELARFLLVGKQCCFCGKAILRDEEAVVEYGNADGPVLEEEIAIHHENGDHGDNRHDNLKLAHRKCHKSFHAREQRAKERGV